MTDLYVVVPDAIDDPARPSGGNTYDRRVCHGLGALGWSVLEHVAPGCWPRPDATACSALSRVMSGIPDGAVVLLDGLVASTIPEVLLREATRLRLVVLVHMPLGCVREGAALSAAMAVVTTSGWTRRRLLDRYALPPDRVHVVEPGVDVHDVAPGTADGGELLCVATVTPDKGHEILLRALARVAHLPWRCRCVGSLSVDPGFAGRMRGQARERGIANRVSFTGPLTAVDLDATYAAADVLVLASRAETYGMVVTEALARGLPVVATAVGGLPEALGQAPDGSRPGLLVPRDDEAALTEALHRWLVDSDLRRRLRRSAEVRRLTLSGWSTTGVLMSRVLAEVAA